MPQIYEKTVTILYERLLYVEIRQLPVSMNLSSDLSKKSFTFPIKILISPVKLVHSDGVRT